MGLLSLTLLSSNLWTTLSAKVVHTFTTTALNDVAKPLMGSVPTFLRKYARHGIVILVKNHISWHTAYAVDFTVETVHRDMHGTLLRKERLHIKRNLTSWKWLYKVGFLQCLHALGVTCYTNQGDKRVEKCSFAICVFSQLWRHTECVTSPT